MGDMTDAILSFRRRDMGEVVAVPRMDKLIKISSYMPCRILGCVCHRWTSNGNIDKPSYSSICGRSHCNHQLIDHVSHLVKSSEKMLNALVRLIFDFENINEELEYMSKSPVDAERDSLLKQCKNFIHQEIKHFISAESVISIEDQSEIPPFESPSIVDILKFFCLHKFSSNIFDLKLSLSMTNTLAKKFDEWIWTTPENLPKSCRLKFNNSYKFYYQKYQEHCHTPNSNHPITKPTYKSSTIFGHDILKYTFIVFRLYFIEWCIDKSEKCTFIKKCLFLKAYPKIINLLKKEVYDFDSPIFNPNFMNTSYPKKILDTLNLEINEMIQSQFKATMMNPIMPRRKNNNFLEGVTINIPHDKNVKMFRNYVALNTILDTFECIQFDNSAKTSLKNFIININTSQTQEKEKHIGIEMIVFERSSNFAKCVLCRKELRNMYQTLVPRLEDTYITTLETDEKIITLALLEDGIPVGGMYFRTFNSQGFSEIVLCIFKIDLHVIGYESCLMDYFKDLHIKQNIWHLLVYADKEKFAFYKNLNFSSEVKILKTKYNKYIVHHKDSKLMHCNLKK